MFDNNDQQIEHQLESLKNSITPSSGLARRIASVTSISSLRYPWYRMIQKKLVFMIPAAVALIVVIALIGGKNQGSNHYPTSQISLEDTSVDEIINSIVNDTIAEQSIADESDTDVALVNSDSAALDSFAGAYDANEY